MLFDDLNDFSRIISCNLPLIGIDYGQKKIGISVSDLRQCVASSREVYIRGKFSELSQSIGKIVKSENICGIVLGLPLNMDGSEGRRCQSTREFAKNLLQSLKTPIVFWDERLTTIAAERTLLAADLSRKKRSQVVDMVASTIILQGALDRLGHIRSKPSET
ncbi:Holliday junction resolvase RuvX [bacterium TMED277]|nr:MAG: Holliday junction resolvase RuvX [bacterium TMED277]|tara:strand:- start:368 stop:853 length:486 start_codon:yes stop_codon:yes gene_type:complete